MEKSKVLKKLLENDSYTVKDIINEQGDDDPVVELPPEFGGEPAAVEPTGAEGEPEPEEKDEGPFQVDYILSDFEKGNLLCITLESERGDKWTLTEWVNLFDLELDELKDMVDVGYQTMLEAAMTTPKYTYNIGKHDFKEKDIETEYFQALVPKENFKEKATLSQEVDYDEFIKELDTLKMNVTHSNA